MGDSISRWMREAEAEARRATLVEVLHSTKPPKKKQQQYDSSSRQRQGVVASLSLLIQWGTAVSSPPPWTHTAPPALLLPIS